MRRVFHQLGSVGIAEAILGVIIVQAIGALVPGQWGFSHWELHPLWAVVLAIAVRYAVPAGYIAGTLAAASQVLALWLRPDARFERVPEHALVQPFLFVVIGVLVAHAVESTRRRLADTERLLDEIGGKLQAATNAYQAVQTSKLELEKQIAGQPRSITMLYQIAKQLETLHVDDLYPAILDVIERSLECQACALYLMEDDRLRLRAGVPTTIDARSEMVRPDDGLIGQAITERRVVTIRDRLLQYGSALLSTEPVLMAGPLVDVDGEIHGVIVVEQMPFLKFTPAAVSQFAIITDWASIALQQARLHEQTRKQLIVDEATGAYTAAHTMRLIHERLQQHRRYDVPTSFALLRIEDFPVVESAMRAELARSIVAIIRQRLRSVDSIGLDHDADRFVLILPMTGRDNATKVLDRIIDDLNAASIFPYRDDHPLRIRFAVVACSPAMDSPETVLAVALRALALHEVSPAEEGSDAYAALPPIPLQSFEYVASAAGSDD